MPRYQTVVWQFEQNEYLTADYSDDDIGWCRLAKHGDTGRLSQPVSLQLSVSLLHVPKGRLSCSSQDPKVKHKKSANSRKSLTGDSAQKMHWVK